MSNRKSGIEVLRIIAAIMVVISHLTPKLMASEPGGGILIAINFLSSISVCAVNIFIIISGYFLLSNNRRTIGKALNLVALMAVINVSSYLLQIIIGSKVFSLTEFFRYALAPNYFVTLYIVLYLISPYINLILQKLSDNGWMFFTTIIFVLFSVYAIATDVIKEITSLGLSGISPIGREGSQHGYNIVNFILLYCLGAFIKCHEKKISRINTFIIASLMLFCTIVVYLWSACGSNLPNYSNSAHSYHNPFVILMAICIFILFTRVYFQSNIINYMAKAAFTMFLLHQHFFSFLKINSLLNLSLVFFLVYILLFIIVIYLISWVVWKVYDFITGRVFLYLDKISIPYGF